MKKLCFIMMMLLPAGITNVYAQKSKADEHFKLYHYGEAIPLYEKYLADHPGDYDAMKNLALSYQLINNTGKAAEKYHVLIALPAASAEDLYQYIQLLRIQQNISEAKSYAQQYKTKAPGPKADNLILSLDQYQTLMASKDEYDIINKTALYDYSVYGAIKYNGAILVTAESKSANTSNWTGRGYTDLFLTDADFKELRPFAKEVMTKLDDGTPTFTDNGATMYYTGIHKNSLNEGTVTTKKLKISIATLSGGTWVPAPEFPYNSIQYKTAHPAISPDGTTLVFASDMPGGMGGMDLYMCRKEGGSWSNPKNITNLNTADNELFPSFDQNANLIFSSNGLPGLGGLDIFKASKNATGFGAPVNLKAPINSSYDDFSLFSDDNMTSGYFSSNRFGNPQIDDVAYFSKAKAPAPPDNHITGLVVTVVDKYTRTPLPYVSVTIKDKSGQVFHQGLTDPQGKLSLDDIPPGAYTIQGMLNDVSTTLGRVTEAEFKPSGIIEKELQHNDPRFTLAGIAVNTKTHEPLEGVTVQCTNTAIGIVKKQVTGKDGKFFFQLEQNSDFEVQGQKKGWLSSEVAEKTTKGLDRSTQLYVDLELNIERPVSKGTITLKKIHYDYDKCNIRPDAAAELNRLVKLMNDYPDMTIELSSHTDARGSDAYNLTLSQCRADAAIIYLQGQGITKKRLTAKGYGETRLLNECKNGVECPDTKHEENRRTEFTILTCSSCPELSN